MASAATAPGGSSAATIHQVVSTTRPITGVKVTPQQMVCAYKIELLIVFVILVFIYFTLILMDDGT